MPAGNLASHQDGSVLELYRKVCKYFIFIRGYFQGFPRLPKLLHNPIGNITHRPHVRNIPSYIIHPPTEKSAQP